MWKIQYVVEKNQKCHCLFPQFTWCESRQGKSERSITHYYYYYF